MIETQKLPTWIDSLGKAVGVIAAASLTTSIVYDWGFYYALDLSFSDLPTSLADHIRSTLVWAPVVACTAFLSMIYELLTRRIEGGMTEEEIIQGSPNPERTSRMRSRPYKFMTILAVIILFSYILFGESFSSGLPIALMLVWFSFSSWANRHPRILERRPPALSFMIHWIPPFIIWMAFAGYNDARSQIKQEQPRHIVCLKEAPQAVLRTNVVRTFERGVLIKTPGEKNTIFLAWPSIQTMQSKYERKLFRGILCNLFNLCSPEPDGKLKSEPEVPKKN
jgi:hypothetical protein